MSKTNIQGKEFPINKIFSDDLSFEVPLYQRPYAWTTKQAEELFEDLVGFSDDSSERTEDLTPYFLGSIVLIKGDGPDAEIVDGQQRLTTLAILVSAIRELLPLYADKLTHLLYQEEDPLAMTPAKYRLTLSDRDNKFFQDYIQHEGGIEKLRTLDPVTLSDSQKNICNNAIRFLNRLQVMSKEQRFRLAQAIITRCYLVVVSTSNFDSAYRIFSVLNDRGLNLSHADILKADIIGKISIGREQARYSKEWEHIEELLGHDMFQTLFAHIRMIYRKAKPKGTVLAEFREYVWPTKDPQQTMEPKKFIDTVLIPYAEAYSTFRALNYHSAKLADKVNGLFRWLDKIDNSDWIPPAILYYSHNHNDPVVMVRFFADLERLAAGLMVLRANVNERIERYSRLLVAIENNDDLYVSGSPLQLKDDEQMGILTLLNDDLYGHGFCKYILLRLDESLADGGVPFNFPIISIEHVLPQHPNHTSVWVDWFPTQEQRNSYVHRLGNLVLLSHKKNAEAQNFEFDHKQKKYFTGKSGVCPFPLTTQVLLETEWTPLVVERRQRDLINKLKDIWRLN